MLEWLFGPKDPTKDWQRTRELRLEVDLERGALNGVRLTEPADRLSFLGPVEDRAGLKADEFRYDSLGLSVGYDQEKAIDCFQFIQKDPACPQGRPFPGQCWYQGRILDLARATEPSFVEQVGSPYWRDEDEDEILLFYEFPAMEWQVEFAPDGTLNRILVTSAPLLADPRQREAYGLPPDRWPE